MKAKFNTILERIAKFAENLGKRINSRMVKIGMCLCFTVAVLLFGSLIFILSFFQSLFGTKEKIGK